MKKAICLLLSLLLCLGTPALAETTALPAVRLPITAEAYQAAYEAVVRQSMPGVELEWNPQSTERGEFLAGVLDGAEVSVMVLTQDGLVTEVAVMETAEASQDSLFIYLGLVSYAGAALLPDAAGAQPDMLETVMTEALLMFLSMASDNPPETFLGLPIGFSFTPQADGSMQYYFIFRLTGQES